MMMARQSTYLVSSVLALCVCSAAFARSADTTARAAMYAFSNSCFSPFLTAEKAAIAFNISGVSYDFYDLDPYSSAAPSPANGRATTFGTDRRCEVSFAGDYADDAVKVVASALTAEGILTPAHVPAWFEASGETRLLAARRLNPRRVAVVHVGTRNEGARTFMAVERLLPTGNSD